MLKVWIGVITFLSIHLVFFNVASSELSEAYIDLGLRVLGYMWIFLLLLHI